MIPHSKPFWGEEEISAVVACSQSLQLKGAGRMVQLEGEVSRDLEYAGAVATPTGSSAISLALRAQFPSGARVGCPSYICRSVYDAIVMAGCQPCLLDVDPVTFSTSLVQARGAGLDAVVVAHMFGIRAPIEDFLETGLFVVEDCAQRLAPCEVARREPKGSIRMLSFEATKILAAGEGGLLLSDDTSLLEQVRRLRDGPYDFAQAAPGFRPTEIQAAVALIQWRRLDEFLRRRRKIASFYLDRLDAVPAMRAPDTYHYRFLVPATEPSAFMNAAAERGVIVRRPVAPACLHQLFGVDGSFPISERTLGGVVSLPIYPALTDGESEQVATAAVDLQRSIRAGSPIGRGV
jgi:dTDP-4-amino-4,6-dideoxygalactose transaminase